MNAGELRLLHVGLIVAVALERVADNAAEIGARVRFLVTGETVSLDPAPREG